MLQTFADVFRIATFQPKPVTKASGPLERDEELRRLRSELPHLDAHLLRDIGLEPEEHDEEYHTPIWRWSPR